MPARFMTGVLLTGACVLVLLTVPAGIQADDAVLARLDRFLTGYEERLSNVVAEETYRQSVEHGSKEHRSTSTRTLRSDFALTLTAGSRRWVGYRDTFEVDGKPVRDRDERLQRLLSDGAVGQAAAIARQNARFNLGQYLVNRNINVPTFALELMSPRMRDRVRVRRRGAGTFEDRSGWLIEFREQGPRTFVRTPEGGDQPSRVVALSDMQTGDVLQTVLTWERVKGSITVSYGRVPRIPVPLPVRMVERYVALTGEVITADAVYANFRQFQTSVRIVR
jgi:hypothetical protein